MFSIRAGQRGAGAAHTILSLPRQHTGTSQQIAVNNFTLQKRPSPPAYCFSFAVVSSERCRLSHPIHAAVFGARVPLAEQAAGAPGSPGASRAKGRYLDIVQSGAGGKQCLKAFCI